MSLELLEAKLAVKEAEIKRLKSQIRGLRQTENARPQVSSDASASGKIESRPTRRKSPIRAMSSTARRDGSKDATGLRSAAR